MVEPSLLCRKHLLGEHGEIHKHKYNFIKKHKIDKRISPVVQIEPKSMSNRHDKLVIEMLNRGYNHKSPYYQPDISYLPLKQQHAKVNIETSYQDLIKRCPDCAMRIKKYVTNYKQFRIKYKKIV